MTDLSRRAILGRVGAVGAAGLATGTGTYALLRDGEQFSLSAASGTLDLQLATSSDGGIPDTFTSESGVRIAFPTFSPESPASGESMVALRSCTNPALARLTVPSVPDEDLADHITVTLRYSRDCASIDTSSTTIYRGPLSSIDDALGNGVPLSNVSCREVGKLEYDDSSGRLSMEEDGDSTTELPYTFDFGSDSITVTKFVWDGDKVIGLEAETDGSGFCRIDVKGGTDTVTYHPGCADVATELITAPNRGGQQSGLSHVRFWMCDGERQCITCESPACLKIEWSYEPPKPPKSAESLANQELEFDLEFEGRQCRHATGGNA